MKKPGTLLPFVALAIAAAACDAAKSSNPLSPTVSGPIPGVDISAPKTLEPTNIKIPVDQQPLTLLAENAGSTGVRPLSYVFEVAADVGFSNMVFVRDGVAPGDGGRTSLRLPDQPQRAAGPRLQHRVLLARARVRREDVGPLVYNSRISDHRQAFGPTAKWWWPRWRRRRLGEVRIHARRGAVRVRGRRHQPHQDR